MTPEIQTYAPSHISSIVARLHELNSDLGRDAAALIGAFVARAAPEGVTVCLSTNTAVRGGVTVKLSPNQAVVLRELAGSFPSVVCVKQMHRAIYGAQSDKGANTVRVMMTDIRKRLAPLKVAIENQNGRGYRLELHPIP